MSAPFKWHGDDADESVCIRQEFFTAVYLNPAGDVVIRQQDPDDTDDAFVIVSVDRAAVLIEAIAEAAGLELVARPKVAALREAGGGGGRDVG